MSSPEDSPTSAPAAVPTKGLPTSPSSSSLSPISTGIASRGIGSTATTAAARPVPSRCSSRADGYPAPLRRTGSLELPLHRRISAARPLSPALVPVQAQGPAVRVWRFASPPPDPRQPIAPGVVFTPAENRRFVPAAYGVANDGPTRVAPALARHRMLTPRRQRLVAAPVGAWQVQSGGQQLAPGAGCPAGAGGLTGHRVVLGVHLARAPVVAQPAVAPCMVPARASTSTSPPPARIVALAPPGFPQTAMPTKLARVSSGAQLHPQPPQRVVVKASGPAITRLQPAPLKHAAQPGSLQIPVFAPIVEEPEVVLPPRTQSEDPQMGARAKIPEDIPVPEVQAFTIHSGRSCGTSNGPPSATSSGVFNSWVMNSQGDLRPAAT
mmetsp:Transcript_46852/g.130453  ORF Transcript_46852/g.130453 Transcript_46852/m.130453 type:complete len:381 (+) Transcript_46852:78-1220(+)